jgi:branched-chain amino acid:cation transporter, LIVCS family
MKTFTYILSLLPQSCLLGLALFSMFFGAGNIIFPLAVGKYAAEFYLDATYGLLVTAVLLPLLGVMTMILYEGNQLQFFGKIGKTAGLVVATFTISLLGPLGSSPRCVALSYASLKEYFPGLSSEWFSLMACLFIFLATVQKKHLVKLLGAFLTPFLLFAVFCIIIAGFYYEPCTQNQCALSENMFFHGMKEGYNTMDLLAAFFFSSSIVQLLKKQVTNSSGQANSPLVIAGLASVIAALLLALVYTGFSFLAAKFGGQMQGVEKDLLLSRLSNILMGKYAGICVCLITSLACLSTAIALLSSFADFVQKELCGEKISYELTLSLSLLITFFISIFEFNKIAQFLGPVLEMCYPGLIALTLFNFFTKIKNYLEQKVPLRYRGD